jgi:hypothetical protein
VLELAVEAEEAVESDKPTVLWIQVTEHFVEFLEGEAGA